MPTKPILDGYITSNYGWRILNGKKEFHNGVDISSKSIKPIILVAYSGIITHIDRIHKTYNPKTRTGSFGLVVYIKNDCDGYYSVYPHMSEIFSTLKIGDQIKESTPIGIMGNTGYSFGPHLHFELRKTMMPGNSKIPIEIINLYPSFQNTLF